MSVRLQDFTDVCDKELSKDDFYFVYDYIKPLSAHWRSIAISWRLRIDTINSLDTGNNISSLQRVIEHWLKKDYDYNANGVPCWRMVCVAVKEGGDSALANDIAQDHPLTATPLERTNVLTDLKCQKKNKLSIIPGTEIGDITYFRTEKLGDGSNGTTVYKGQFKGQDIAVKVRKKVVIRDTEIQLLTQCKKHENIVEYYHFESDLEYYYLAFQLCLTSLEDFIQKKEQRDAILKDFAVEKKLIISDTIRGLTHLHKKHIVHRDVKPSNILLAQRNSFTMEIKAVIADFGIAAELDLERYLKTTTCVRGTSIWIAPELLKSKDKKPKFSKAVDVFSMGCVIYYVLSDGQHPFGNDIYTAITNFDAYSYTLDDISDEVEDRELAKHLIVQMIHENKDLRIPIEKVLEHYYFWSEEKQLKFLERSSDILECTEDHMIEHGAADVIGANWMDRIDTKDISGNYDATSVKDLLRAIKHSSVSLSSVTHHFPKLLIHVYKQMKPHDETLSYYYQSDAGDTRNLQNLLQEKEQQNMTLNQQLEAIMQELAAERELRQKAECDAEMHRRRLERMEIEQVEREQQLLRYRRQLEESGKERAEQDQEMQSYYFQVQAEGVPTLVQKKEEKELQKYHHQLEMTNVKLQEKDRGLQEKDKAPLQLQFEKLQEKDRENLQGKDTVLHGIQGKLQELQEQKDEELEEKDKKIQEELQGKVKELQKLREDEVLRQAQYAPSDDLWVINEDEVTLTNEELGRGSYGSVRIGIFRGLRVAVKSLHNIIISPYNLALFSREMSIASRVRHPNLVQYIGATKVGSPLIVTELMSTSLRQEICRNRLTKHQILSIAQDVALGLNYLHLFKPQPIIHRDVSSPNVLLKPCTGPAGYEAKVADYGTAKVVQAESTGSVMPGNPAYAAPEAPIPDQHSPAMDVYSYSVLLMEMNLSCPPEITTEEREIQAGNVSWSNMRFLIQRGLDANPRARPTMAEIIELLKIMIDDK